MLYAARSSMRLKARLVRSTSAAGIRKAKSCGECSDLPCSLILGTRDPSMTEEEFMKTVDERVKRLKG